ncbi:MAG: hypothetical protein ACK5MZ_02630 [Aestuariibaculum sp.]
MKKIVTLFLFAVSYIVFANNPTSQTPPNVGDVLTINAPKDGSYNHIDFPKLNTIVKRGSVANYKSVYGQNVVVKAVNTDTSGKTEVVLKSRDNKRFFGFAKTVKANYFEAIKSGELAKIE